MNDEETNCACVQKVPKTDLFEIVDIPDMCLHQNKCLTAKSNGCYLSLIKRKKVTRLDAKQLIIMAENRKLFGDVKLRNNRLRTGNKSMKKQNSIKPRSARPREKRSHDIVLLVTDGMVFTCCFARYLFIRNESYFRSNDYRSTHILLRRVPFVRMVMLRRTHFSAYIVGRFVITTI